MLEDALTGVVTLLAFAGGFALVGRLFRTGVAVAFRAAEAVAAAGMADISARKGDLTDMMERRRVAAEARRARRGWMLLAALWLAWLVLPVFLGVAREAYAVGSVLWLLPRPTLRVGPPPPAS